MSSETIFAIVFFGAAGICLVSLFGAHICISRAEEFRRLALYAEQDDCRALSQHYESVADRWLDRTFWCCPPLVWIANRIAVRLEKKGTP